MDSVLLVYRDMAALKVVRIDTEEDAFAADETKVHTLSRQAISEMLDTADRQAAVTSSPPPASGVRGQEPATSRPAPTKSGMIPIVFPKPAALPLVWEDDGEDSEPTKLCSLPDMPRRELVTQLINDPPIILCPPTPVEAGTPPRIEIALHEGMSFDAAPEGRGVGVGVGVDRRALAITLVTFMVTLVPGLVLLHHFMSR
jgi:hypothetical protein